MVSSTASVIICSTTLSSLLARYNETDLGALNVKSYPARRLETLRFPLAGSFSLALMEGAEADRSQLSNVFGFTPNNRKVATKKSGTKKMAKTVAESIPPMVPVPIAF
jgi:hypothetical protein